MMIAVRKTVRAAVPTARDRRDSPTNVSKVPSASRLGRRRHNCRAFAGAGRFTSSHGSPGLPRARGGVFHHGHIAFARLPALVANCNYCAIVDLRSEPGNCAALYSRSQFICMGLVCRIFRCADGRCCRDLRLALMAAIAGYALAILSRMVAQAVESPTHQAPLRC
jgi:hypothetical protein